MKKYVFLKLGGSLITDKAKPYTAKVDIIRDIALQIKAALQEDPSLRLLIGNGSGSFAHYAAQLYKYPIHKDSANFKEAFVAIQQAAIKLNRILVDELIAVGIHAISVHPSSFIVTDKGKTKHILTDQIRGLLDLGIIPVVYGDPLYDTQIGAHIYSTEKVFEAIVSDFIKHSIKVESIIQASIVPGILDSNNHVIPHITKDNYESIKPMIYKPAGFDVTGGMLHKIEYCLQMRSLGIHNYIVSGLEKNTVQEALLGRIVNGTSIY